ncbi:hypothetical protein GCM10010441_75920 [Kitasatospora paracochleata]|uniref:Uncharacterized protein n=1 Tax=Kitasatospora paracochleata TaxID=58354 RepID=A0ABT1J887_9ACTN|nr:hypothetical protein [Kitasatospora paracochleata]MCP2313647.1 hypothetical protein [Kitasatospora paracochleata]
MVDFAGPPTWRRAVRTALLAPGVAIAVLIPAAVPGWAAGTDPGAGGTGAAADGGGAPLPYPTAQALDGERPLVSTREVTSLCDQASACSFRMYGAPREFMGSVLSVGNGAINCTDGDMEIERTVTFVTSSTDNIGGEISGSAAVEGGVDTTVTAGEREARHDQRHDPVRSEKGQGPVHRGQGAEHRGVPGERGRLQRAAPGRQGHVRLGLPGLHAQEKRLKSWGNNGSGQLGNGTTDYRITPVPVPDIKGVQLVGGGREHTVALLGDNTVRSWGNNGSGQLGNGTTTDSATPVTTLTALTGVDKIAAPVGGDFSLAN